MRKTAHSWRYSSAAWLLVVGLPFAGCERRRPAPRPAPPTEPQPVDGTESPPATARDEPAKSVAAVPTEEGPPTEATEKKRPATEAQRASGTGDVEAACAELKKLVGARSFVATYEVWRVGKDERLTFEIAFSPPDKGRLIIISGRNAGLRWFADGPQVYVLTPDGKALIFDMRESGVFTLLK